MIFSNDTHRPSSVKLWQIPHPAALPMEPGLFFRLVPLEAQDTSYFADSARIFSFSSTFSFILPQRKHISADKQNQKEEKIRDC
jgi:hypothetical protein